MTCLTDQEPSGDTELLSVLTNSGDAVATFQNSDSPSAVQALHLPSPPCIYPPYKYQVEYIGKLRPRKGIQSSEWSPVPVRPKHSLFSSGLSPAAVARSSTGRSSSSPVKRLETQLPPSWLNNCHLHAQPDSPRLLLRAQPTRIECLRKA